MEIRPLGSNNLSFPIRKSKVVKEENMVEEPNQEESILPPKWTGIGTTVIIIPKGNVSINKNEK